MAKSLKVKVQDLTRMAVHNGGKFPLERRPGTTSGLAEEGGFEPPSELPR
jgi:hypothetical protein